MSDLMTKIVFLILLGFLLSCQRESTQEILLSPDGLIKMTIKVKNGQAFYEVSCDNKTVLKPSGFSFEFKNQRPFGEDIFISKVERSSFDESWKPVYGTDSIIRNQYNEIQITFSEHNELSRSIVFVARVFNNGIAFRYVFPSWEDSLLITNEKSLFKFDERDSAWWIPANEFAYESLYRHTKLSDVSEAATPLSIETIDCLYLCIHEAALIDYSEMYLQRTNDSANFSSTLWPESDSVCVRAKAPFKSPWRCVMIGRKPGDLIESHMIQNLNDPCAIKDVSWIKPMKFIGIWWGMHLGKFTWFSGEKHGATTERAKQYIDFAAAHHIGGVLAEGWNLGWDTWASGTIPMQDFCKAYPDFDLQEVVAYAKSKNVEFISHHETGGNIPEYERQMEQAMQLCEQLGIRSLKTGYAGPIIPQGYHHHGQYMVRHFQRVVETAARYHITINAHESIKPTGIERTWPNLMTQEAARGNEWNATYKATPPYHACILPFTRFLAGPYDYTPGIFNIDHSPDKNKRLYCTRSYQMAMFVVFYSPLMMVSDMIENYENQAEFRFIEEVPCTWDETSVIDAKLGDYVCIARRKDDTWFIGSIGDENAHQINIKLDFLNKGIPYVVSIFGDDESTNWETNPNLVESGEYIVQSNDIISITLAKAGGNAMIIRPAQGFEKSNIGSIQSYNAAANEKMKIFSRQTTYGNNHVTHLALNKSVRLEFQYSPNYPASGNHALCDGERGSYNYSAGGWQGFEGVDLHAIIDLQKVTSIRSISVSFLSSINDWIFFPTKIEFFVSENGQDYKKIYELPGIQPKAIDAETLIEIKDFVASFKPINARYVQVKAQNIIQCPPWHSGKGGKAWLFCDEIVVK